MTTTGREGTTTVAYHADYLEAPRPAVDVKVRPFHWNGAYSALVTRLADNPSIGSDRVSELEEIAFDMAVADFWRDAAELARSIGLGEIETAGRSGGWLVISAGDPEELETAERIAWLASYRVLSTWADDRIARAPAILAELIEELADDMAVAP